MKKQEQEKDKNQRPLVCITGMGMISAAGQGIGPLWNACLDKKTVLKKAGATQIAEGNSLEFCLYALQEAMKQANWDSLLEDDILLLATTTGQMTRWDLPMFDYADKGVISSELSHFSFSSLSEAIKSHFSFKGRVILVSSACSASTQALEIGRKMILTGRAKRVLAGGVEALSRLVIRGFDSLKLLSDEPCKPFDKNRKGINLSEGAAFYTLENQQETKVRPLAFLLAGASILDSYSMTSPEPTGKGLKMAIEEALFESNLVSHEIDFIHAHGTGSWHNDQAENNALSKIFFHQPEVISTKGVHGHLLGASGAIEIGICLEIFRHGIIPPSVGLENKDPSITLNLPMKKAQKKVRSILKTTLGFGGVNSVLIIGAP